MAAAIARKEAENRDGEADNNKRKNKAIRQRPESL